MKPLPGAADLPGKIPQLYGVSCTKVDEGGRNMALLQSDPAIPNMTVTFLDAAICSGIDNSPNRSRTTSTCPSNETASANSSIFKMNLYSVKIEVREHTVEKL